MRIRCLALAAVSLAASLPTLAPAQTATLVASPEPGWPQWRGPRRDGRSTETGLLQSWPPGGPPLLWSSTNLGSGYSSPVVSGDLIVLTGDVGEELHIFALDLRGRLLWRAANGASWKNPFPGARACSAYSAGRIYHLNAHGRLVCLDAITGATVWHVDTAREFGSRAPTWGMGECVLVYGDMVIVTPGGTKAAMAALDKHTGSVTWRTPPLAAEPASAAPGPTRPEGPAYASPILIQSGERRIVVGATARHFIAVDARTGALMWRFPMPTTHEVLASTPVLCTNGIFVTGPDGGGGKLLPLKAGSGEAKPIWTTTLDTCHGNVVAVDGYLYGSWYRTYNGWGSVDLKDGSVPFRSREVPMGSVLYADNRLYCLAQNGAMTLVQPDPSAWRIVGRFQLAERRQNDVWAHPVILDRRLYLRHQQVLNCYDIQGK